MEPEKRQKAIRYYEIDLLRFIAALSVVLFHYTYFGPRMNNLSPVVYPGLGEVFRYGYLGVELFFMISGYVVLLSAQGKTLGQFFTSRVMRLYPAFWVACTLCFVVVRLFGPAVHTPGWSDMLDAPIGRYVYNMTMLHGFMGVSDLDGVYWTLQIELIFYFLVALLIAFQWFKHLPLVLAVWLAGCAVGGPSVSGAPFVFLFFPRYAPFFIGGMVIYLLQTKQAKTWQLYGLLAAAYALSLRSALVIVAHTQEVFQVPFSRGVVVAITTACFATLLLISKRKINLGQSAWLAWAGALTYPIYLLHHNMGYVVLQHLGGKVEKHVLLLGLLLILFAAAYLLHIFVERRYSKVLGNKLAHLLAKADSQA